MNSGIDFNHSITLLDHDSLSTGWFLRLVIRRLLSFLIAFSIVSALAFITSATAPTGSIAGTRSTLANRGLNGTTARSCHIDGLDTVSFLFCLKLHLGTFCLLSAIGQGKAV